MTHKFLEHTADVKFQAQGKTIEQAFTSAADALNETIYDKIKILAQQEKTIAIKGTDQENLLYNFLEEFLFLLDAQDFLVKEIKEIKITQPENKINQPNSKNDKITNRAKRGNNKSEKNGQYKLCKR